MRRSLAAPLLALGAMTAVLARGEAVTPHEHTNGAAYVAEPGSPPGPLADLRDGRPWLPEKPATLTPEMTARMDAFTRTFGVQPTYPRRKGVKPGAVADIAARVAALGLRRDDQGRVTADKPILWNGEWGLPKNSPAGALDFMPTVMPLVADMNALYANCAPAAPETRRLEEQIRIVLEFFVTRDWNPSRRRSLWVSKGYALRGLAPVRRFTSLAHLLDDPLKRARVAENLWWMLDGSLALEQAPAYSTDALLNTVPQAFTGVAALPAGPEKYQRILTLRRALDSSIINHDFNLITPDGGVVHHDAHHDHYAQYSFVPLARLYEQLERCGFRSEHSAEINRRMKLAGDLWAWATLGAKIAPNMSQRVKLPDAGDPPPDHPGRADFAVAAAYARAAAGGPPPENDRELAGLVLAVQPQAASAELRAAWAKAGYTAAPLAGAMSLPCDGAVIHRRPGWMVTLRGQNKTMRGGEGVGGNYRYAQWCLRNTYAERFCHGSIFVADSGTPLDIGASGWVADGFDYSRVPGTTGPVKPPAEMVGAYFGTQAKLGGGCTLAGQSLWMFAEGGLRKSCFLVDDRITFVTSGVAPAGAARVTTTVFQNAESAGAPMLADGAPVAQDGEIRLPGATDHALLDARARGYFFHAGGDDIVISRGVQSWTYCEAKWFNPAADPGIAMVEGGGRTALYRKDRGPMTAAQINQRGAKGQFEGPEKLRYFHPTTHRYATAGYEHGPATTPDRVHAFTLLMKCDAQRLAAFGEAMRSARRPVTLKTAPAGHAFADAETGLRGHCVFLAGDLPTALRTGVLTALSRPGTVLEHERDGTLRLAVASTDIADRSPFILRVDGRWQAAAPHAAGVTVETGDASTRIQIPYTGMAETRIELVRVSAK